MVFYFNLRYNIMNNQYVIIGLSSFSKNILDEIIALELDIEILIIDKDETDINLYKDKVTDAIIANITDERIIQQLVPVDVSCVIIDLGSNRESSILISSYLKKMGVKRVIVKAETDTHGEILKIAGVDEVIHPDKEAARRLVPTLVSSRLFQYMPIGKGLVFAELKTPEEFYGKTLLDIDLRRNKDLNLIAVRKSELNSEYMQINIKYLFNEYDLILLAGNEKAIFDIAYGEETKMQLINKAKIYDAFKKLFNYKNK